MRVKDGLAGTYQTDFGSYRGWISENRSGTFWTYYILQPPQELASNSHWPCFSSIDGNWFQIHMREIPRDVSSGIMTVERVLTEAFKEQQERSGRGGGFEIPAQVI